MILKKHNTEKKPLSAAQQASRRGWISTLTALLIFAIIFVIVRYTGFFKTVGFTTSEDGLVFSGPSAGSLTVPFSDIDSIEYIAVPDYGTPTEMGGTKNHYRFGTWISPTLGEYTAYSSTRITPCALIRTTGGLILFNYENEDTTKDFADIYGKYCEEQKGAPEQ